VDSLITLIWLDTLDISSFYLHTSVADTSVAPHSVRHWRPYAQSPSFPPSLLFLQNLPLDYDYSKVRMISSQYRGVTCFALASEVSCNTMSLLIFCPSKITTA
jgi:hypothetical protein